MAGIKQPLQDVMTKLQELTVINGEGNAVPLRARVFNNQIERDRDNKGGPPFQKPAAFVEVKNGVAYQQLGGGYQSVDLAFRIHLVHQQLDAGDGTMDQDLAVFDLRDQVITKLSLYEPTGCGPLTHMGEDQDFDHDNLYHYAIDFVCNFTESKGSLWDKGELIDKAPPTNAQLDITTREGGPVNQYIIP